MPKPDDPIDTLFQLPLTEFIGARKELAARLKKSGYADEAARVRALTKPSVSAWTVNQLYWKHREAFDELIATCQRFRKAQVSGKMAAMREALDARREALSHLSDLATEFLRDSGHNPSLDTLRRIATTLEALSSLADGLTLGRLTQDVDPPGFDSFGSFVPTAAVPKRATEPAQVIPAKKPVRASAKTSRVEVADREKRQARIAAAKVSLQAAKKSLTGAHAAAKSLEAARTRAEAVAKEAERQMRQAEERFKKASAASDNAAQRAQSIAVELTEATTAVDEAKRAVEIATRELETAFRESSGTRQKGKGD